MSNVVDNKEVALKLETIKKVKRFISITQKFEEDIDLQSKNKHYVIDAKSILGIFSLDLRKPVVVNFIGAEERRELFLKELVKAGILK